VFAKQQIVDRLSTVRAKPFFGGLGGVVVGRSGQTRSLPASQVSTLNFPGPEEISQMKKST
jgi:hypothetical protein